MHFFDLPKLFKKNFKLFITSLSIYYSTLYLSKAGAKVDTFYLPSKSFEPFFML